MNGNKLSIAPQETEVLIEIEPKYLKYKKIIDDLSDHLEWHLTQTHETIEKYDKLNFTDESIEMNGFQRAITTMISDLKTFKKEANIS